MKTKKFLKKYLISEAGEVSLVKGGEVVKVKKGKVSLKTPKGKKKFKVSDLMATYFPKERKLDDNGEPKKRVANKTSIKPDSELDPDVERHVSRPDKVRNYYKEDPDGFKAVECAQLLDLPVNMVRRTIKAHWLKIGVELDKEQKAAALQEGQKVPKGDKKQKEDKAVSVEEKATETKAVKATEDSPPASTMVVCTIKAPALHKHTDSGLKGFEYLTKTHRHVFHIEVAKESFRGDEIAEGIIIKNELGAFLVEKFKSENGNLMLGVVGAEDLAGMLLVKFELDYCKVMEDGENGVLIKKDATK